MSVRYDEHNESSKKSEPAAHLEKNIDHYFTRRILCNTTSKIDLPDGSYSISDV